MPSGDRRGAGCWRVFAGTSSTGTSQVADMLETADTRRLPDGFGTRALEICP